MSVGRSVATDSSPDFDRCAVCGAARPGERPHKHELPGWKPRYDDFEGALEGYEMEAEHERT
jgi:hypothetical protein